MVVLIYTCTFESFAFKGFNFYSVGIFFRAVMQTKYCHLHYEIEMADMSIHSLKASQGNSWTIAG